MTRTDRNGDRIPPAPCTSLTTIIFRTMLSNIQSPAKMQNLISLLDLVFRVLTYGRS